MNTNERKTLGWKVGSDMKHFVNWRHLLHAGGTVALAVCINSMTAAIALITASAQSREAPTATSNAPESHSVQEAIPASTPLLPMPPTRLVPQPEGTPLPPQDPTIADTWPPEFKQLIDNMIALTKSTSDTAPDIEEIKRRFGITLVAKEMDFWERKSWQKLYEVNKTRYVDPTDSIVFRSFYGIGSLQAPNGERSQRLRLQIEPKLSGFCLNPYELAVYTGWTFSNFDTSPHANIRQWPPAYVWGMFAWSNTGQYGGSGYSVMVSMVVDSAGKIVGTDCVSSITVSGLYPKGE